MALGLSIALAALLLGGCGGSGRSLTLQVFADPEEAAAYRELIAAFEEREPGIDVRLVAVADQGDHMTKLSTAFAAGSPPDLFLVNYRRFGQFAGQGVLEPLGPRSTVDLEAMFPQAVEAFGVDGTQVCLPQNVSTPVVYFNRALFAQAGLDAPPEGWTWDVLLDLARKLTGGEVRGLGFEPSLNRFAPFVWQAGGEIVDDVEDPRRLSLAEPPDREALEFLTDLQRRHQVVPSPAEFEAEDPEARFLSGRLAMLIESRRIVPTLRAAPGLEWDVAPLPVHPRIRKPVVMLHSDAYCMAGESARQDDAVRFVDFALGEEGAAVLARTGRTVPSLRAVAQSEAFLQPDLPPASARVFLDQIAHVRRSPNIARWSEIESKADVAIEEWFFGREDPRELSFEIDVATGELTRP